MIGHDHRWGESRAADQVWKQVNGLRPSIAGARLLMILQAFIDESQGDDIFVLAGYLATAEQWADFSREWEHLLPMGVLDRKNKYSFKMSLMAMNPERMERVAAFYRVIEKNLRIGFSTSIRISDWRRAVSRLKILLPQPDFGYLNLEGELVENHYYIAFSIMLSTLTKFDVPDGIKIDLIFDERSEKGRIFKAWETIKNSADASSLDKFGSNPRFEDDTEFLPLQAADFLAWWVRQWQETSKQQETIGSFPWERHEDQSFLNSRMSEDAIFSKLAEDIQRDLPNHRIIDLKSLISVKIDPLR